jgi:hypothetical protein
VEGFDKSKVIRVLPHRHDTGGFFVALLRKKYERTDATPAVPRPLAVIRLNEWMGHKRWQLLERATDEHWASICDFYGICDAHVPFHPVFHVNPNGGPQRRICLITDGVRNLFFGTKPYKGPGLEVITVGVRAFEIYDTKYLLDAKCRWRVAAECASYLASIATKRKLELDAFRHRHYLEPLLLTNAVLVSDTSDVWPASGAMAKGSLLLGIAGVPIEQVAGTEEGRNGDGVWWLSATLNGPRLELAVDGSIKALILLVLYGITMHNQGDPPAAA